MNATATPRGRVSLVGAGPGDPELMTRKAWACLMQAELVLVDELVDRRILAELPAHTRVLQVGKRGGCASTEQGFIHALMIRSARQGLRVVRLKGGDPFIFGRGGEEMDALQAAGIEVEVINGLSAGLAGPSSVGISVTDRRCAPGVALVTGHNGEGGRAPDWAALARSGLTLVVYMGVSRCAGIVAALMEGGLAASTPVAVISAAHTEQQREAFGVLALLPALLASEGLGSPAVLVIGEVAAMAEARNFLNDSARAERQAQASGSR
ncbi:uroporphyrinogen-III C-methyltransferase [Mitsuaria sp. WAJ17]|uniref:uroporphyrinogen-III C-methyltransferase n=1 Tax=Mitsuaria sp. WAJ17 TaxID=2761452 RepID=UPI001602F6C1|nr:uroporphyrinogen-III C-methyltransferase [Mitsuaria sp. WAJ17]MBB2485920.1 uroporphyrinogen-III C-methyltransferase [Mitsuaria sp. WAJ17]